MAYTLYGSPLSPFVRKVKLVLLEKKIEHAVEEVIPFSPPPGWREISPLGKIPALRHDDKVINDSSVICEYLERLHPSPSLYPADPYPLARARWLEEYVDGGLMPVAGGKIFFELIVKPLIGQTGDEAAAKRAIDQDLPPFLDYLEAQLAGECFVGGRLSIADLTVGNLFVNLRLCGVKPTPARWPKLAAFVDRLHARESFQAVIDPMKASVGKLWV